MTALPVVGRRDVLARGAAAAAGWTGLGAAVSGCGFQLRQTPQVSLQRLALTGFAPRSPMAQLLEKLLLPGTQVVASPAQAQAVLHALADRRERSVVASTAAGQVRELQLRVRLEFRLALPGGRELIGPTELRASRDMSYSESFALAKEQEEAQLFTAMQTDIALQVIGRLARVTLT
ncbi:MAG: LPS assembly lipoprotein LptE [Aquabacterium sp.]